MSNLVLRGIEKRFGDFVAVDALDLELQSGEFVSLLGPSGCGKTTTLRMIAGFIDPSAGTIEMDGRVLSSPSGSLPPETPRHVDDLPELCHLAEHDGGARTSRSASRCAIYQLDEVRKRVGRHAGRGAA